jgi:hypothetical protein
MRTPLSSLDIVQRAFCWTDPPFGQSFPEPPKPCEPCLTEEAVARVDELFRASGGLATSSDVLAMLRMLSSQPLSQLAHWIVERHVVHFDWRSQTFFPLGQFDLETMHVKQSWRDALVELADVLDDWQIAHWFAAPNARLKGMAPADIIHIDPGLVIQAARLDAVAPGFGPVSIAD